MAGQYQGRILIIDDDLDIRIASYFEGKICKFTPAANYYAFSLKS